MRRYRKRASSAWFAVGALSFSALSSGCDGSAQAAIRGINFSAGAPVLGVQSDWAQNGIFAPHYPDGTCMFAVAEMWQKYLQREGVQIHPAVPTDPGCDVRLDEVITVTRFRCLYQDSGLNGKWGGLFVNQIANWIWKAIPFVRLKRLVFHEMNWQIYLDLEGSRDIPLGRGTGGKIVKHPSAVLVSSAAPDTSTGEISHAILVSAMFGTLLRNTQTFLPTKVRVVDSNFYPGFADGIFGGFYSREVKSNEWPVWAMRNDGSGIAALATDTGWVVASGDIEFNAVIDQ